MATTKRSKGGRAASRAKATARGRAAKSAKPAPKKKTSAARPVAKAKPAPQATKKPAKTAKTAAKATRAATKPARAAAVNPEVASLKSKFQRERNGLEKRLTDAVREIGLLRHHELRAMQFERQLAERDATIERLQRQLSELERRPAEPVYVHEVQQSLALGAPSHHHVVVSNAARTDLDGGSAELDHSAVDLDEFEDDRLGDDGDLVSDDD